LWLHWHALLRSIYLVGNGGGEVWQACFVTLLCSLAGPEPKPQSLKGDPRIKPVSIPDDTSRVFSIRVTAGMHTRNAILKLRNYIYIFPMYINVEH
jgi:hypothetical protein